MSHMLPVHCEVLSCSPELRWRVNPESVFDMFGTWVLPFVMNSKGRPSHNGRFANCIYEASLRNRLQPDPVLCVSLLRILLFHLLKKRSWRGARGRASLAEGEISF